MANLLYSLAGKATELLDRHLKDFELKYQKLDKETLTALFSEVDPRKCR